MFRLVLIAEHGHIRYKIDIIKIIIRQGLERNQQRKQYTLSLMPNFQVSNKNFLIKVVAKYRKTMYIKHIKIKIFKK